MLLYQCLKCCVVQLMASLNLNVSVWLESHECFLDKAVCSQRFLHSQLFSTVVLYSGLDISFVVNCRTERVDGVYMLYKCPILPMMLT